MHLKKVLFVGLGGAGQRHLRILRGILPAETLYTAYRHSGRTPRLDENFRVDNALSVEEANHLKSFESLESAFADSPDLVVISNPTSCHRKPMMMAIEAGCGVLVEKPWADTLDGFAEFQRGVTAKRLPFLISFQRRFHPLIAEAHRVIRNGVIGAPVSAFFSVFSNVPSWHPYEDWRELYAVRPELGGGVLLTEIHEIDLANWFFGLPSRVFCAAGNWGSEKLQVEDTAQLSLLYGTFGVTIELSFMHRRPRREFHVAGTEGELRWDAETNALIVERFDGKMDHKSDPQFSNDAMFRAQDERFVRSWSAADSGDSLAAAWESLAVVDAARRSMRTGCSESVQPRPEASK